jgi:hypothetical protein
VRRFQSVQSPVKASVCEAVHRPYELLSCASSRANTKGIDGRSSGRAHGRLKLCKALTAVSCGMLFVSSCTEKIEAFSNLSPSKLRTSPRQHSRAEHF